MKGLQKHKQRIRYGAGALGPLLPLLAFKCSDVGSCLLLPGDLSPFTEPEASIRRLLLTARACAADQPLAALGGLWEHAELLLLPWHSSGSAVAQLTSVYDVTKEQIHSGRSDEGETTVHRLLGAWVGLNVTAVVCHFEREGNVRWAKREQQIPKQWTATWAESDGGQPK
jgi:hypothetical protein